MKRDAAATIEPPPSHGALSRWGGLACVLAAAVGMFMWSMGQWPDVLVDFGGEVYVPWRIAEGDVLYRDQVYFTGPLSPYWNALLFKAFGVSLRTIFASNLVVLTAVAVLLYRLILALSDRLSATVACVLFFSLFAFAQFGGVANYNFMAPYSHETTHGALLSLCAVSCWLAWARTGRTSWAFASGAVVGLAFLTKVEVFVATASAVAVGFALELWAQKSGARKALILGAMVCVAIAIPVVAAFLLLCTAMEAKAAWHGVLGAWPYTFDTRISAQRFYQAVMGTDHPRWNLIQLAKWSGWWLLALIAGAGSSVLLPRDKHSARRAAWVVFVALVAGLAFTLRELWWQEVFRPLPLFALVSAVAATIGFVRLKDDAALRKRALLQVVFSVYACFLMAKMVLNARIQHYGFALAMPATVLAASVWLGWIAGALERRGKSAALVRATGSAVFTLAALAHLEVMRQVYSFKGITTGQGADRFVTDDRGRFVNPTLKEIERRVPIGGTVAVLPEGVMLNYLARRRAPTSYYNFMPPEMFMFGEAAMLAAFTASPPDLVVLVHKDTSEYGVPFFGHDYGQALRAWVDEHYVPVGTLGGPPLRPGTLFGIQILARRPH